MNVEPNDAEYEVTLTIVGKVEGHKLKDDFDPDHAYGPVERLIIERDMYSAVRNYDILDVEASKVE